MSYSFFDQRRNDVLHFQLQKFQKFKSWNLFLSVIIMMTIVETKCLFSTVMARRTLSVSISGLYRVLYIVFASNWNDLLWEMCTCVWVRCVWALLWLRRKLTIFFCLVIDELPKMIENTNWNQRPVEPTFVDNGAAWHWLEWSHDLIPLFRSNFIERFLLMELRVELSEDLFTLKNISGNSTDMKCDRINKHKHQQTSPFQKWKMISAPSMNRTFN